MSETVDRDASNGQPDQHFSLGVSTTSTNTGNRSSIASTETGESSKRNRFTVENTVPTASNGHALPESSDADGRTAKAIQDGKGSHKSHRSRGSAGFLVSKMIFDPPTDISNGQKTSLDASTRRRESPGDQKGKVVARTSEKRHKKNRSGVGLGIGASPLAGTVINVANEQTDPTSQTGGDATQDLPKATVDNQTLSMVAPIGLDVESAQIVNLALNLSESRRNVARRNISSTVPPTLSGFGEGFAGGSLRQHLQAQRRSSRNISPKPERSDRTFTASPRMPSGQWVESPLQTAFGIQESDYHYHFSNSTLARAEKAKKAIELMAQYRRLLQYVPPLKPQGIIRSSARSPPNSATGLHMNSGLQTSAGSTSGAHRNLGRPYNPLQYIRNRKVRARERKTIDGESQGFGDVERVASWVDHISRKSSGDGYQAHDRVLLPAFTHSHETAVDPTASPQSAIGRNQTNTPKAKRPRVDWITNPADMLADVYWLEQNENKKLVEDNRERKIFPQDVDLTRPATYKAEEAIAEPKTTVELHKKLSLDTKLPKFNPLRNLDRLSDSPSRRARQKLRNVVHPKRESNRNSTEHDSLKLDEGSSSESSESDRGSRRVRHRRNVTAESYDINSDILEKQMLEILAKESGKNGWTTSYDEEGQQLIQPSKSSILNARDAPERLAYSSNTKNQFDASPKDAHHRKDSGGSQRHSGRASLEIPEPRGRSSLDGLDTTAPNSPQAIASNIHPLFVPSIAIDLSPPPSRRASPTRQPALEKVKSIINPFHDHGRSHSRSHSRARSLTHENALLDEAHKYIRKALDVPSIPDESRRSSSPGTRNQPRKSEDIVQHASSKAGSIRRRAEELPSGIRGLFKTGRNPVQRVSDLFWKKETSPGSAVSSDDTSTDESDLENGNSSPVVSRTTTIDKPSKVTSLDAAGELSTQRDSRSYDLPAFTSPFERQDRFRAQFEGSESPESDYISQRQRAREQRRVSRFQLLKPPRIDVQGVSPGSSPDLPLANRSSQNSDVSDLESRRGSSYGIRSADARLNSILGIPGSSGQKLPVTGLTHTQESRRHSSVSQRHWSISDRVPSARGPMTKREVARVQALLLSSGIKAKEIVRRAAEIQDLRHIDTPGSTYSDIVTLDRDPELLKSIPRSQEHILAARILSNDIQLSSQIWQDSASKFSSETISGLLDRVEDLQDQILGRNGLSEMTRKAEREAEDVSRDLVTAKTMAVKELLDRMDKVMRKRRRRFRWVRRAGWVMVEWVLVGVMWWVWLVVVLLGFMRGTVRGVIGGVRWLLWL